ncbi:hypothetical protein KSP40_PGU012831 [Platanthera guangdongensis]|uniref:DUF3741 domain-containing protein n=1 Tax=Platanthera guangdongensis TaxID=2320717 RepID=A0ABR2N0G1_9ASPA
MSTALTLALNSSGKIHNIEILSNPTKGRKIVLHMDGYSKTPYPSPYPSRIGEVAKGVKNLTMILEVCSEGYNLSRDSIELGRELLKGVMDLEESLKLVATLQEASYSLTHSKEKYDLKLLKGKEDGDEESRRGNQHKAGSRSKFSFIRESRSASNNEKLRRPVANNTDRNSSKTSMQSIKGCSDLKPEALLVSHGSHEPLRFPAQSQVSSKANPASQKVRIPNVIAKLMGLEELPAPVEEKSADTWCGTQRPLSLKDTGDNVVKIDEDSKKFENSIKRIQGVGEQETVVNDIARSDFRRWRISDNNRSPASKDLKNACARKYGQMVLINQTITGVRKEGVPQEETNITERQIEGRTEYVIPLVGNYLPEYAANNIRVGKRNVTIDGDENVLQQTKEKIDASVKMIDSDLEQKRTLSMLNAKHENQRKKKLILIKEELGYDMRTMRGQSGKEERVYSNSKGSVNRTASQPPKENIKTYMTNKNIHNKHRGKKVIEQISEKRLPLNVDTRKEMARTSIQAKVMRKPTMHNQSLQKLNDLIKISECVVQAPLQNKDLEAHQSMDRRHCAIEPESRWKERNKKLERAEKCEDDSMRITNCNPFTGEETKTAVCSNLATGCENIQDSMDQPIHVEIKVKSQEENSVSQLAENSCIPMTERVEECSGEDVKEKCEDAQSIKNKEEATNPSRLMQLNNGKYIACQDWAMEVDQQVLTEHEDALKQKLITSHSFLNIAQSLFQIKIPVRILQENASPRKHSRLVIDCGNEILRRKGQREEVSFSGKCFLAPLKRSIDALIKEVNADLESLKYENNTCDYDLADYLHKMIENDIRQRDPDINCLWDIGWDNKTFVCFEKREIVRDVEKHLLNGLLNELATELLRLTLKEAM